VRIVYLLTTLGVGGAEKQAVAVAEQMAARGHAVSLVVLKHTVEEWPVKLPVLRLNMRKSPLGVWRGLRFASNFLALFRPDLMHSHTFPANLFSRLLRLGEGRRDAAPAIVNTIHNVYEGGWHRMAIYTATDPLCDAVTAVSRAAAERYARLHAVSRKKLSVLTNGIDTGLFAADRVRKSRVRKQMLAGDRFIWLAVGRIAPAKDYPNLLRAFALAKAEESDMELWIAGEGVSDLSEDTHVRMLGLRRDVVELLDAADGFVLSSAWEGLPLALGEAMAMEKPVVATDVGGVRELAGKHGVLVPAKDSQALAVAMLGVMRMDRSSRRFMGRAARARIETDFSMEAKADAWEALYERTIHERHK
jgi:glycosyltransferase involved in cell wall biosynthesis